MHGTGCKADDRRKCGHQRSVQALLTKMGAPSSPLGHGSLTSFATPRMDQDGGEGCTAHASSNGMYIVHAANGAPLGWVPSQDGIWGATQSIERSPNADGSLPAFTNTGVMSVDVFVALSTIGAWPMGSQQGGRFSDAKIPPSELPFDLMQVGAQKLQSGMYRIDETDSNWPILAALCIDNKIPVYVGRAVGSNYMNWKPGNGPLNIPDIGGAGHATLLTGYDMPQSGGIVFEDIGSYGLSYADNGIWSVTGSCLQQVAFDVYALAVQGVTHA